MKKKEDKQEIRRNGKKNEMKRLEHEALRKTEESADTNG